MCISWYDNAHPYSNPPFSADYIVHATAAWCLHKAVRPKLKLNNGKATTKYVVLEACGLIDLQYVNQ